MKRLNMIGWKIIVEMRRPSAWDDGWKIVLLYGIITFIGTMALLLICEVL